MTCSDVDREESTVWVRRYFKHIKGGWSYVRKMSYISWNLIIFRIWDTFCYMWKTSLRYVANLQMHKLQRISNDHYRPFECMHKKFHNDYRHSREFINKCDSVLLRAGFYGRELFVVSSKSCKSFLWNITILIILFKIYLILFPYSTHRYIRNCYLLPSWKCNEYSR